MRKSEIYDKCVFELEKAYLSGKLNSLLTKGTNSTAVVLSVTEGEAGPISRCWGVVFKDPDTTTRCTEVHVSYYGESVVLEKLLKEITRK